MSPQHSNREALIEGALHCLEEHASPKITARQIATASGANLASISYHFGSTETLLAHAMAEGFRRWSEELAAEMGDVEQMKPLQRIQRLSEVGGGSSKRHVGLVRAYLAALARAAHDEELRSILAAGYRERREKVAVLLGLGDDRTANMAASLIMASSDGLLVQEVLDPEGSIDAAGMQQGFARLIAVAQL